MSPANRHAQKDRTTTYAPPAAMLTPSVVRLPTERIKEWRTGCCEVHQGIRHRRSDFLHKHSTAVIRKYGTVKVEGLNVSGMSGGNLAKQILDCSWSEWFRQLRYSGRSW